MLLLDMTRVLNAPVQAVFEAFSESNALVKWFGPMGFTIPDLRFRPVVGDSYRIEMRPPDGGSFHLTGEFRDVDPPTRLSYTFVWEDPDPDDVETLVALSFRDLGGTTEVLLSQGPFKTQARRELHCRGWTESFDKLERLS
jgi:uncharacterized protein YndB with AHSA1/START domain